MRNSTLYQEILAESRNLGRLKGRREVLLQLGRKKFGSASPTVEAALNFIEDREYLDALINRLFEVVSWDDLFCLPRRRQVHPLECSSFLQMIVEEGTTDGELSVWQKVVQEQGSKRFGEPCPQMGMPVHAIHCVQRLREIVDRLLDVSSWDELLAAP